MDSQTDIIKDKLNILDIVSEYVKLEKSGKTYKGKSPFTNEKTPSFFVSPDKGFFYCFSSGKGGDIFTFIQEIERVDFLESLKILAEKAGVNLKNTDLARKEQSEKDRLFLLLDIATKWYEVQLRKNKEIVQYLLDRGLTKDTIIKFRLGFAKDNWRDIYTYLNSKKFTDSEIEKSGLIIPKQGSGYYDRFRSRIMFPLFDGRGRVVGFSGRIWGNHDKSAKYINSPEGPLFDKSKVLYGYHIAKSVMSKKDYCILVEGQLDVLLSQQSGYENTVAISGTGLTDDHVKMIKRFTDRIYLALDSDKAGIKATRRSVIISYKYNMQVKVILLKEGEDPADTIKRSKEAWDIALMEPLDYVDYRISLMQKTNPNFDEKQNLVQNDLFELVFFTKSSIKKDNLLQKIALFLGTSTDAVRNDFESFSPNEKIEFVKKETVDVNQNVNKDLKKELLFLIFYIEEMFIEDYIEIKNELDDRYFEIFNEHIFDAFKSVSNEELAMSVFVIQEKMPNKEFKYFKENILSMLDALHLDKLEIESRSIQEAIRKEQIINPSEIPKDLMKKSSDIRKKIDSIKNILS